MSIVQPYIAQVRKVKSSLENVAKQIVLDNAGEIVNLVKYNQLSKGLNSMGQPLRWAGGDGTYSDATQAMADFYNISMPKPAGAPYNFVWTGETLDNMKLKAESKNTFDIFTVSAKQNLLEGIYGEIFKLTKEHNDFVNNQIIIPGLQKYALENLFAV